ncbi:MAG: hypothetical protein C0504_13385 [Candidatus Solibacter sp.]|nr:hypothetical protein [Candidatus Solibacter sp.]
MKTSLAGLFLAAVSAFAAPVTMSGTGEYGSFTGTIEYIGSSNTTGSLVMSFTNTTPVFGGYITGVVFNNPGGSITDVTSFTSDDPDFQLIGDPNFEGGINGAPYGDFDIGSSLGDGWLGAGSPVGGIAVGETATFTFTLAGGLAGITTDSFIMEHSTGSRQPEALVVRFRGMLQGQSDKVPATFGTNPPPPPPPGEIPEPGTYAMMGLGLGLAALARKFNKK